MKINNKIRKRIAKEYVNGLGTNILAKKFNLSKTTIRRYLLLEKVKFRRAPKDTISKKIHIKFVSLYKNGYSIKQISKKTKISFATVQRHLNKENIKLRERGNPVKIKNLKYKKLTLEKAYILGVVGPGDGFVEYNKDNGQYRVCLEATNKEFINYFAYCLKKVYGIKPKTKLNTEIRGFGINPTYLVRLGSKEVCNDLLNYGVSLKEENWRIPKQIMKAPQKIKAKYIQGFADSQGCASKDNKQIILANQNLVGLKQMNKLLQSINIKNLSQTKSGIVLCNQENIRNFRKNVNFNIKYKKLRLNFILSNYKIFKNSEKKITKIKPKIIELRKNGLTFTKIAKELNISVSSAWRHSAGEPVK